jgi:hypothetical protein
VRLDVVFTLVPTSVEICIGAERTLGTRTYCMLPAIGQTRLLLMRYPVYLQQLLANHLRRYNALKVSWLSYRR